MVPLNPASDAAPILDHFTRSDLHAARAAGRDPADVALTSCITTAPLVLYSVLPAPP
jgi:hypothetical protein